MGWNYIKTKTQRRRRRHIKLSQTERGRAAESRFPKWRQILLHESHNLIFNENEEREKKTSKL